MAGYFGTEAQQRLQAEADAAFEWALATPGACNSARMLGTDDPDRLGWDHIMKRLESDGIFSFRLMTKDLAAAVRARLEPMGYRLDLWDVFDADREAATRQASPVVAAGLPEGFAVMDPLPSAEHPDTRATQEFMAAQGITPFSGAMLAGELGESALVRIADASGRIAATAYGYLTHNAFSRQHGNAWGGLVAVDPAHRGKRLGAHVNALMVLGCFERLGATRVHEYVAADNAVSRRTVEASGLRLNPDLTGGAATKGAQRFTR